MAARLSRKRLPRYSLEFKLGAVKLTEVPGVEVQGVAHALDIHPVMLSGDGDKRRGKEACGGSCLVRASSRSRSGFQPSARSNGCKALEKAHALLQEEHALLNKSEVRPGYWPSSDSDGYTLRVRLKEGVWRWTVQPPGGGYDLFYGSKSL